MPYRRTRSRGTYYRRRPARPTTWVRNDDSTSARLDVANGELATFDLLAPLHTGDSVLKVGGQYDSAPSTTGRTCVRILGQLTLQWNVQAIVSDEITDGAWVGILKGTWPWDTASKEFNQAGLAAGSIHPWDPVNAANTSDWCYWRRLSSHEDMYTTKTDVGTDDVKIGIWNIDVRAKRRLSEIGDTMILSIKADGSGTQGVEKARITTSVLLR